MSRRAWLRFALSIGRTNGIRPLHNGACCSASSLAWRRPNSVLRTTLRCSIVVRLQHRARVIRQVPRQRTSRKWWQVFVTTAEIICPLPSSIWKRPSSKLLTTGRRRSSSGGRTHRVAVPKRAFVLNLVLPIVLHFLKHPSLRRRCRIVLLDAFRRSPLLCAEAHPKSVARCSD